MPLFKKQMSSAQQHRSVDGERFSVSKTAKTDPVVEAVDSLAGGVTLAIRGSRSRIAVVSIACDIQQAQVFPSRSKTAALCLKVVTKVRP